jgi:hypothetical protein
VLTALSRDLRQSRKRRGVLGDMPNKIAKVREPCLCQSLVNREIGGAQFSLEFEGIDVELCARHDVKPHCGYEYKIGPRPPS